MTGPVTRILLLLGSNVLLSGCVASMAVSALGMAAQSARGRPVSNEALQPQAREQCSAQAAQYGAVNVIDVEQHRIDQIIVWGTVDDGKQKRSFQCDFGTKITGFTLRPITPQR
jgi:hypothetical protein